MLNTLGLFALTALAEAGFTDPTGATRLIEGWRSGRYPALRSPPGSEMRPFHEITMPLRVPPKCEP